MSGTILMILEIAGTAAFAVSGAMMGIRKQMDLLGVLILGIITAVGGGILRDIILGITPPLAFRDPLYTGIAAFVAAAVIILRVCAAAFRWSLPKIENLPSDMKDGR